MEKDAPATSTNVEDKFFMGEVNIHNEEEEEGDEGSSTF